MTTVKLNDPSAFELVSGLWKSDRLPLTKGRVLRSTNFNGDGLLDFSDVVELEVEERHAAKRQLKDGDIIIERSGGGPKQPVGRVAFFKAPDEQAYFSSNFTTTLRIRDQKLLDPEFVSLYLHALYLNGDTETLQRATTGIRNLDWQEYLNFEIPKFDSQSQRSIRQLISKVRQTYQCEQSLLMLLGELKQQVMKQLFTCGLSEEKLKDTEIGLVPSSWDVVQLGVFCTLSTGTTPATKNKSYYVGNIPFIKTGDVVNNRITSANTFLSNEAVADYGLKLFPTGTILMAMYGQGKTRGQVALLSIEATTTQNAAAIQPSGEIDSAFLWHYLRSCYERLRGMGSLGHVSHLNLGYLRDLLIIKPPLKEQREIAKILDVIDRKIAVHQTKKSVLDELFRSLLNKLMTGELSVNDLDLSALSPDETQPQTETEVQL